MSAVFKKLNFKNQPAVYVLNAPASFSKEMDEIKSSTAVRTSLGKTTDVPFLLAFVTTQKEVDDLATTATPLLSEDAIFWFAYPKGTSKKYKCEFNRDNGWDELGKLGYEGVRMVAIDDDWSALRFRKAEHIKTMTRRSAMSEMGRKKIVAAKKHKKH